MMPSAPAACTAVSPPDAAAQVQGADLDGNMTSAAQPLNDRDIEVLADYLAGLSPQ
jgi:cytochrome c553